MLYPIELGVPVPSTWGRIPHPDRSTKFAVVAFGRTTPIGPRVSGARGTAIAHSFGDEEALPIDGDGVATGLEVQLRDGSRGLEVTGDGADAIQ